MRICKFAHTSLHTRVLSVLCIAVAGLVTNSCGNSWMVTDERKNSPSALMLDADTAFDEQNYDKAASLYQKIVDQDPNNHRARIRLSYTYNAIAGLGVFDLVKGFSELDLDKVAEKDKMAKVLGVVGLSTAELSTYNSAKALDATVGSTATGFRGSVSKLSTISKSWKVICPFMKASTLTTLQGQLSATKYAQLKTALAFDTDCGGGIAATDEVRPSALFAGMMAIMAEASSLWQVVVDADANGEPDLIPKITALSSTSDIGATGSGASATDGLAQMAKATKRIGDINALKAELDSELFSLTLGEFKLVTLLIKDIPGMPKDVADNLTESTSQIDDAQAKLDQISGDASATTTKSDERVQLEKTAEQAVTKVDSLYTDTLAKATTPEEQKKLNCQTKTACDNIDGLKTTLNMPDLKKPDSCTATTVTTVDTSTCPAETTATSSLKQ